MKKKKTNNLVMILKIKYSSVKVFCTGRVAEMCTVFLCTGLETIVYCC